VISSCSSTEHEHLHQKQDVVRLNLARQDGHAGAPLVPERLPLSGGKDGAVQIVKQAVQIEKRNLSGRLARDRKYAYTKWFFQFYPQLSYDITENKKERDTFSVQVKITAVKAKISLPIYVYLSPLADKRTVAHEFGHVEIAQNAYNFAEKEARRCALSVVGKTYAGEGRDLETATGVACGHAIVELSHCYQAATVDQVNLVSKCYDTIETENERPIAAQIELAKKRAQQLNAQMSRKQKAE
jgi:hypothetical protein